MAGYQYLPGTIVNNIKSLLRERYKQGFPIIKEIIQNANDGRATNLEFGIVQGLGNIVEHPLLKIPALFFINNGTFSKSDKEAIKCFGIDANANDKGKIGKFGLGQKSIFHFCEAFFYIARSQEIPEGCGEFINPWANAEGVDSKRLEWGEISAKDRQELEKYLTEQKLIKPELNYFILWIPLRQKMVDDRCILANYYNDAKSVESNLPQDMKMRIGQLLPLLRHLKNVRYWLENDHGSLQPQFAVGLDNKQPCQRFIYPNSQSEIIQEDERDLQGNIIINSIDIEEINFAGKERILPSSYFALLINTENQNLSENFWHDFQKSEFWTKRLSINENAESENIPDKSIPHCAVVFTKQSLINKNTKSKARLMLQWSVFLPLASEDNDGNNEGAEQETYEIIDCEGNQDYTVFLHGYFFLDSGRKYIEGLKKIRTGEFTQKTPTNEDEMIAQWNYLLATKGTLKLFLSSLERFVKIHNLSNQDIYNLCQGIAKSQFFTSVVYKQSICSQHQWVFRIKPSLNVWELIPDHANMRSLPGIPPNWQVFPVLQKLAEQYYLIDHYKPNLLLNEKSLDWQEQEIVTLLSSLDLNLLFAEDKNLNYLVDFLRFNKKIVVKTDIQNSLINLLQKAFINIDIERLQENKFNEAIKKIVELIDPQKRYKLKQINANEQTIQLVLRQLYQLNITQPLLIYELFEPKSPTSNGALTNEQIQSLLTCLNQFLKTANSQNVAKAMIEQIIDNSNSLETVLNLVDNLPLFFGYNHQQSKTYIYSYLNLQELKQKQLLFKGDKRDYETEIAKSIKAALPECNLIFIETKIARILEKTSTLKAIPQFNHQSCLQLLATKPNLANCQQRAKLLQELINHV